MHWIDPLQVLYTIDREISMVQGSKKMVGARPGTSKNSATSVAKAAKKAMKLKKFAKKGTPLQLPKGKYRDEAIDDHTLTKAIDKASEQKVAAKFVQGGGKLGLKDVMQAGKELNKEQRRKQVKRKVGRVEEKLNILKEKAEQDGKNGVK
jgi:hypothetical protein